ncbi:MAG TPA: (5-formylfuran-3-yl)methyl phosphate synthase [Anaerolineaceae bacterium]|nr:(5-formylfuran-3-yl)methyl phosphate synthase [Anaerolineaceae bacterium]
MQLMISVVSVEEAVQAMAGKADILDVKNPDEGSLGAQPPRVLRAIRKAVPGVRLSVALGDLPNLPGTAALAGFAAAACGADFIKAGLLGTGSLADAARLMREICQAVSEFPGVEVIAAGYADSDRAGTLDPGLLPAIASQAGAAGCLIDTAIKDGCRLFDFLSVERLRNIGKEAHASGLLFGLAGSLREEDLLLVRDLGADVVGIRGAVCGDGRRGGPLEADRVRRIVEIVHA